jgi:hypothetical protein
VDVMKIIALERLGDAGKVARIPGLNGLAKDKMLLKFKFILLYFH